MPASGDTSGMGNSSEVSGVQSGFDVDAARSGGRSQAYGSSTSAGTAVGQEVYAGRPASDAGTQVWVAYPAPGGMQVPPGDSWAASGSIPASHTGPAGAAGVPGGAQPWENRGQAGPGTAQAASASGIHAQDAASWAPSGEEGLLGWAVMASAGGYQEDASQGHRETSMELPGFHPLQELGRLPRDVMELPGLLASGWKALHLGAKVFVVFTLISLAFWIFVFIVAGTAPPKDGNPTAFITYPVFAFTSGVVAVALVNEQCRFVLRSTFYAHERRRVCLLKRIVAWILVWFGLLFFESAVVSIIVR